ncbi:hypothetical protein SASPL_135505 [Salvia splendens]|uniref:Uncharacterized protein n=1 Tax=Salvia splendens TaxID=180675 RepID=A0A8X8ZG18_SALSN|nr:hypothetical protein SASPL_135505 [Salvia splendens]
MLTAGTYNLEKCMTMKGKGTKRESSSSNLDSQEPRINIKSILKDVEFLGEALLNRWSCKSRSHFSSALEIELLSVFCCR